MNFLVADFVARVNVALSRKLISVYDDSNSVTASLLDLFQKNGLIRGFKVGDDGSTLVLLKYYLNYRVPSVMKIVSTPGRRVFWKMGKLSLNYNLSSFSGFFVISSSKGFVTSNDALLAMSCSGEMVLKVSV